MVSKEDFLRIEHCGLEEDAMVVFAFKDYLDGIVMMFLREADLLRYDT